MNVGKFLRTPFFAKRLQWVLLDETEMAQNNSLFVWKTSNYNRGRSKLRNDMDQVTNMKSLGFTRERIAN